MCRLLRRTPILAIVLASLGARPAGAQDLDSKPYELPDARVAALDVALYNAKEDGRDRIVVYDPTKSRSNVGGLAG